jgi:hypothetical protein
MVNIGVVPPAVSNYVNTLLNEPQKWLYVFVRTDLPVSQIVVQTAHATYEAGQAFANKCRQHPSFVVLGVKNKEDLEEALKFVSNNNLDFVKFFETTNDQGFTSFAVEPVEEHFKMLFQKFSLFTVVS